MSTAFRQSNKFALLLLSVACAACGAKPQDNILDLRDKIDDAADSLRYSQKTEAVVQQNLRAETPWFLIFVPATGLEDASVQALPEDAVKRVRQRLDSWSGHSVVVYAIPKATSITSLPDNVRLERQIVLRGEAGAKDLVARLLRSNNVVSIDSVMSR
jgi:hypothetical protein